MSLSLLSVSLLFVSFVLLLSLESSCSLDIFCEVRPASIRSGTWGWFCGLFAPAGVENVWFVEAKLGHCDLRVIRLHVLHNVCLWWVLVWRGLRLEHSRGIKSTGSWDWGLLRRNKGWRHHPWANRLWMNIVARAGQFFLAIVIVVIKLVYSISVTMHFFAHAVVRSLLTKRWIFFIGCRWWASDLFGTFIVEAINVKLEHVFTPEAHRPAIRAWDIRAKCARLRLIAIGWGQHCVFRTHIMVLKALLMRAECESPIAKVLRPIEITRLVKYRMGYVLRVLLERGEATRLTECELLLGHWVV